MVCYDALTETQRQEMHAFMRERTNCGEHFSAVNHIRLTAIGELSAEGEMDILPQHLNSAGIVHGGCLVTLADTVSGIAASSKGISCVTISSNMNFLRAASSGKIRCRAEAERAGNRLAVFRVVLTGAEGTVLATGSFTFHMLQNAPPTQMERDWNDMRQKE